MFNFTRALVRQLKNSSGLYSVPSRSSNYSTPATAELKSNVPLPNNGINADQPPVDKPKIHLNSSGIVAAAFAALSSESSQSDIKTPFTDNRIENATSVDDLLAISNGAGISRKHALKVVSVLANWATNGKVKLADFESDARFIKLCKVLTKNNSSSRRAASYATSKSEDLTMIMNVAADDEAAKLIASITIPQMIKVMQALAAKKRRSTLLLRTLAFNITKDPHKLDLKQSADLLYCMCILNFLDANLLAKISSDIQQGFETNFKKSSVIGSIITSLGILRYKDTGDMLDIFCNWIMENASTCRTDDVFALFLTLAVLNYEPSNANELYHAMIPQLTQHEAQRPNIWLDFVWSLVVLNRATQDHIDSVLKSDFVATCESMPAKLKLLHINAANTNAETKLPDGSEIMNIQIAHSKEKEEMVNSIVDTLKNWMKTDIRSNIHTNMGFLIDAECAIDKNCIPVTPNQFIPTEHQKVAIMALDYHDMSRGRVEPIGMSVLHNRLLERNGYKVIFVPFYEYRVKDKLIHRIQLIESKLRALKQS